jgi:Domain of unknown function (DUF4263)
MPYVLVGTNPVQDPAIIERYVRVLQTHGVRVDVTRPMSQVPETVEMVARAGGKIDAVVLAHHSAMSSSSADTFGVARSIRRIGGTVAFLGAVRACTLPIVAVTDRFAFDPSEDIGWFEILDWDSFDPHPEALVAEVFATITGWRQSLLEELEYVGYAITVGPTGELDVSHTLRRRRREGEILTDEATPGSLRTGQYLILAEDLIQEFAPYLKLRYLLNNYQQVARAEKIKPETVFQRFFEEHPHLIRRDLFDKHWAQPSLRVPGDSKEYLRPDFVLRPRVAAEVGTKWQILDLKLPDDPLVVSHRFHAALSAKLTKAIQQLQDYREYFNRPDTEEELARQFGIRPLNPRLAVLIGRRDRAQDVASLDKAQGPRYLDIEVLTYDEMVDLEANRLAVHSALARVF